MVILALFKAFPPEEIKFSLGFPKAEKNGFHHD